MKKFDIGRLTEGTIIISYYDSGVSQTIWMDGEEVYAKERDWMYEKKIHPLRQYVKDFIDNVYTTTQQRTRTRKLKELARKYKRSVLFCENGQIEYYPYSSKETKKV